MWISQGKKFVVCWGVQVMLCSSKAVSLGVNLTAASRLVIFEECWNPVYSAQVLSQVLTGQ